MNEDVPKLLRAIASGSQARENGHDIILNVAADEIDRLREALQDIVRGVDAEFGAWRTDVNFPLARRALNPSK